MICVSIHVFQMTSTENEREVGKEKEDDMMDLTDEEATKLLGENSNVSDHSDELQIDDPAAEALARKLIEDNEKMDVEIVENAEVVEKREEVVEKRVEEVENREEVVEKGEEEVAKGVDSEKGEEEGYQKVEKRRKRGKKGMEEEERVEVEVMGGGEKGVEKKEVGTEKVVEKAEVGEKGDAKEVEEEGSEWIVWWENDWAEVVLGKGWDMERIRGAGGVERGLFERVFRVGRAFVRTGDRVRLDEEAWAKVAFGERDRELNSLRVVMEVALRFCEEGGVETRISNVLWHAMTRWEKLELEIAKRHVCLGAELRGKEGEKPDLVGKRRRAVEEVRLELKRERERSRRGVKVARRTVAGGVGGGNAVAGGVGGGNAVAGGVGGGNVWQQRGVAAVARQEAKVVG